MLTTNFFVMKRLSFFAAMLALILVATSAFKPAKTGGTEYGLVDDGTTLRLVDITGLTIGVGYDCIDDGPCIVAVTSGTVVDDPTEEDPRFVIVEDGTYDVIRDGVFIYPLQP